MPSAVVHGKGPECQPRMQLGEDIRQMQSKGHSTNNWCVHLKNVDVVKEEGPQAVPFQGGLEKHNYAACGPRWDSREKKHSHKGYNGHNCRNWNTDCRLDNCTTSGPNFLKLLAVLWLRKRMSVFLVKGKVICCVCNISSTSSENTMCVYYCSLALYFMYFCVLYMGACILYMCVYYMYICMCVPVHMYMWLSPYICLCIVYVSLCVCVVICLCMCVIYIFLYIHVFLYFCILYMYLSMYKCVHYTCLSQ